VRVNAPNLHRGPRERSSGVRLPQRPSAVSARCATSLPVASVG
jgi:hypothetical protein